LPHLVLEVPV